VGDQIRRSRIIHVEIVVRIIGQVVKGILGNSENRLRVGLVDFCQGSATDYQEGRHSGEHLIENTYVPSLKLSAVLGARTNGSDYD